MISACADAPAPARQPLQSRNAAEQNAPEFHDILQREGPATEPESKVDVAPSEQAAATTVGAPPSLPTGWPGQPASLHVLLAQILSQQPAGWAPPVSEAGEDRAAEMKGPTHIVQRAPASGTPTATAAGLAEENTTPVAGAYAPPTDAPCSVPVGTVRREWREEREQEAGTRAVAIRHVASAVHFPVVADPVRQIVNEVARALAEPVAAAAPPSDAADAAFSVKTLHVRLEPESLGSVTLRLRLSGNQLSVRVDVAEPATLDMIQREQDRLQKSMASDQVALERFELRAAPESAPVQPSDSSAQTRADTYAPGQQSRASQGEATGGQGGRSRENRREPGSGLAQRDKHESVSNRSSAAHGLYL